MLGSIFPRIKECRSNLAPNVPSHALFKENLSRITPYLKPKELQLLRFMSGPPEGLELVGQDEGAPTLKAGSQLLYSQRSPIQSASRQISAALTGHFDLAVLLGFGLGYHFKSLVLGGYKGKIVLLEPSTELFSFALGVIAFPEFDKESVVLGLGERSFSFSALGLSLRLQDVFFFGDSVLCREGIYAVLCREYQKSLEDQRVNKATARSFSWMWMKNILANLPRMASSPPLMDFKNAFQGRPALLIAAGPTLRGKIPIIKHLSERCVTFCVDTAYKALLDGGICPDFVVAVDPKFSNWQHLQGAPLGKTILAADLTAHEGIGRSASKALYFCSQVPFLPSFGVTDPGLLLSGGGSVATSAWSLARFMGCQFFFWAGLDLGYPYPISHSPGTRSFEEARLSSNRLKSVFSLQALPPKQRLFDFRGAPLPTDKTLCVYASWLERSFELVPTGSIYSLSPRSAALKNMALATSSEIERILGEAGIALSEKRRKAEQLFAVPASGIAWKKSTEALEALISSESMARAQLRAQIIVPSALQQEADPEEVFQEVLEKRVKRALDQLRRALV